MRSESFKDYEKRQARKKERVSDSAPLPCSAKELPLANEFYLGLEWLGAWLVDHAEGETVSEELVVQWCNQAWAKHLLKPNVSS